MSLRHLAEPLKSLSERQENSFFIDSVNGRLVPSTRSVHSKYLCNKMCSSLSYPQRKTQAIMGSRVNCKIISSDFSMGVNIKKQKKIKKPLFLKGVLRHRADSNRCTSFCRALPSHSATVPEGQQNYIFLKLSASFFRDFY